FGAAALCAAEAPLQAAPCEEIARLSSPQTTVTIAVSVAPGAFRPPAGFTQSLQPGDVQYHDIPAFCRVAATMRPSSDSEIKIEVWLPAPSAWNGKFMAVGDGGQDSEIEYPKMGLPLALGYAVA